MSLVVKREVWANAPAVLTRYVTLQDGSTMKQADVDTIVVKSFKVIDGSLVDTVNVDKTTDVYDALRKDRNWTETAQGYNVGLSMPGTSWPVEGVYSVEALVTPVAGKGAPFPVVFEITALKRFWS